MRLNTGVWVPLRPSAGPLTPLSSFRALFVELKQNVGPSGPSWLLLALTLPLLTLFFSPQC